MAAALAPESAAWCTKSSKSLALTPCLAGFDTNRAETSLKGLKNGQNCLPNTRKWLVEGPSPLTLAPQSYGSCLLGLLPGLASDPKIGGRDAFWRSFSVAPRNSRCRPSSKAKHFVAPVYILRYSSSELPAGALCVT